MLLIPQSAMKTFVSKRLFHSSGTLRSVKSLKDTLRDTIPERREQFKNVKTTMGDMKLPNNDITVSSILGGMRNNKSMFWQSSTLDPKEGIRFHGYTIKDCQDLLPGPSNEASHVFYPEAMLWLLMTGEIPTHDQVQSLIQELNDRVMSTNGGNLPQYLEDIINSLPGDMHPMTQLSVAIGSLNYNSKFANNYSKGLNNKLTYWEDTFDDVMTLIAYLPIVTGKIYSNVIANSKANERVLGHFNTKEDWSYNICSLMGMTNGNDSVNYLGLSEQESRDFINLMRLYTGLHVDHEGGNVSAHTTHLVGSALSDPFLSYSSGLMGLAGPLHGLAAQEVVKFLVEMEETLQSGVTDAHAITKYLWNVLNNHRVIPGYGHAVLRKPDPRFEAMVEFARERPQQFHHDRHVQLMLKLSEVAPDVLAEHGKCQNPFPNVDSASGILFHHYGMTHLNLMTVIFGCSRALGPLTQLVWDRIYGLPIERPKSVDLKTLFQLAE